MTVTRTINRLPVNYYGKPVVEVIFRSTTDLYRSDITRIVERFISNQGDNRRYLVNLPLASCGGWRSGRWFTRESGVSLFTIDMWYDGTVDCLVLDEGEQRNTELWGMPEADLMDEFRLLIRANPPNAGGCSENSSYAYQNDCLWVCIREAYGITAKNSCRM